MSEPLYRSAFVPHDLAAPVKGAAAGPLAGLTAALKDMYDIGKKNAHTPTPTPTHPHIYTHAHKQTNSYSIN